MTDSLLSLPCWFRPRTEPRLHLRGRQRSRSVAQKLERVVVLYADDFYCSKQHAIFKSRLSAEMEITTSS